jgi:hypothetical protein
MGPRLIAIERKATGHPTLLEIHPLVLTVYDLFIYDLWIFHQYIVPNSTLND